MNCRWYAGLAVAVLGACATVEPVPAVRAPAFELNGRIAVRARDHAFSSALRWKQRDGIDELWLAAPLGQTLAYLVADRTGATLTTAEHKAYHAASVESLTQTALGWRLPVAALRYWVRGEPAAGMAQGDVARDEHNRLTRLTQETWRVSFYYADDAVARPLRVEVRTDDAELKLVVDSFESLE